MAETFRTLGQPVDERTGRLDLPLPHRLNDQRDDVDRMRAALAMVDDAMHLQALAFDDRANLLEWDAARSSAVAYSYDLQGRVASITSTVDGQERTTALSYDSQGRVVTVAYPVADGATRTDSYNYDTQGRVSSITSTEVPA